MYAGIVTVLFSLCIVKDVRWGLSHWNESVIGTLCWFSASNRSVLDLIWSRSGLRQMINMTHLLSPTQSCFIPV